MTVWTRTSNAARSDAAARLPRGERERAEAWAALERALDLLDSTPAPDWDAVPSGFQDDWGFFVEDLARELPTLAEATPQRFRDLMLDSGYPPELVARSDATRDAFVHTVAARSAYDAARWLAGPDAPPDDATRERIAALAREHERSLPDWLAEDLAALS